MNQPDVSAWTTDRLIEYWYWIRDRRAYCTKSSKPWPNDYALENAINEELGNREVNP